MNDVGDYDLDLQIPPKGLFAEDLRRAIIERSGVDNASFDVVQERAIRRRDGVIVARINRGFDFADDKGEAANRNDVDARQFPFIRDGDQVLTTGDQRATIFVLKK